MIGLGLYVVDFVVFDVIGKKLWFWKTNADILILGAKKKKYNAKLAGYKLRIMHCR